MVVTYTIVLLSLRAIVLVFGNGETKMSVIIHTLVMLPLIGRVIGWW